MDQFDQAQELDARYLQQALDEHRRRQRLPEGESRSHCLDCGDEIPEGRRRLLPGVMFCTACQQAKENGSR